MKKIVKSHNIESSAIFNYKYNTKTKVLTIKFNYGPVYEYNNISLKTFQSFHKRRSVGKAYNKLIKNSEFNKVTEKVQ
jgi:hypothetical protein